jgi:hypothetical protein
MQVDDEDLHVASSQLAWLKTIVTNPSEPIPMRLAHDMDHSDRTDSQVVETADWRPLFFRSLSGLIGARTLTAIYGDDLSGTISGLQRQAGDPRREVQREPLAADRNNHAMSAFVSRDQTTLT